MTDKAGHTGFQPLRAMREPKVIPFALSRFSSLREPEATAKLRMNMSPEVRALIARAGNPCHGQPYLCAL